MTRKPISKRTRFSIFSRDNFTCQYCGRQSDVVVLVVDHLIPVSQGGTNDPENLITACEPCNQGKSDKTISQHVPTDQVRLRLAQERREQEQAARDARSLAVARKDFENVVIRYWCETRGQDEYNVSTMRTIISFARQHGVDVVFHWIDQAQSYVGWKAVGADLDYVLGKYISGIRRSWIELGLIPEGE